MKKQILTLALLVSLACGSVFAHALRTIVTLQEDDDDDDQLTVSLVYNTLMSAETIAAELDIQLVGETSSSDMMVFGINSTEQKHIHMTITDLQGVTTFADREFDIFSGSNFQALNVQTLPEGQYILHIEENGKKKTKLIGVVTGL